MVMTFKDQLPAPGQAQPQQSGILSNLSSSIGQAFFSRGKLDITQTAAKYSNPDPNMSKFKGAMKDLRLTSGTTHGEVELPESAELVFPDLDRAAAQALETTDQSSGQTSTGTRNKWKNAGSWVQDYLDRRSQAFYVNPSYAIFLSYCRMFS